MRQTISTVAISLAVAVATAAGGCDYPTVPAGTDTAVHPKADHDLFPSVSAEEGHVASGVVPEETLEQPIQFTHYRHVTVLQMECEYCHTEARRSKHAGVPPVEVPAAKCPSASRATHPTVPRGGPESSGCGQAVGRAVMKLWITRSRVHHVDTCG